MLSIANESGLSRCQVDGRTEKPKWTFRHSRKACIDPGIDVNGFADAGRAGPRVVISSRKFDTPGKPRSPQM